MSRPKLFTASYDETIRIWDVIDGKQLDSITIKETQINSLAISPDGTSLAAAGFQTLRLFDCHHLGNQPLQVIPVHERNVTTMGFSHDGNWMFTGSEDMTAKVWDLRSNLLCCQRILQLNSTVNSIALHPNCELIVADSAGGIFIWDIRTNRDDSLQTELSYTEFVQNLDIDKSGKQVAAITNKGNCFVYSTQPETMLGPDVGNQYTEAELNPDPSAAPSPIHVYNDHRPKPFIFQPHSQYGLKVKYSPDGNSLMTTGGDDVAKLWAVRDLSSKENNNKIRLKQTFQEDYSKQSKEIQEAARKKWIWDVAFTNDSANVFTAGSDHIMRLFDFVVTRRKQKSMFARKPKPSDVQTSLQKFSDVNRDPSSRAKNFRLALESLSVPEKRQLVDDYSFETFHLVDALLLQAEFSVDGNNVADAELALWTLEQILCLAPELVGKGWQKNAIENILKRALLPNNLIAVRKIAIRLFILWYQSLAVFNNAGRDLDRIFQCLLPYFPLHDGSFTERILSEYCDSCSGLKKNIDRLEAVGFNPGPIRKTPILVNTQANSQPSLRERAQMLQVYLDKFLDYCHRETIKIEWNDESKQLDCAKFLLDRIIVLYIYQVFPDMEENGVDVFEGWEGSEEPGEQLDTADPVVIARYWLIRWMTNIAAASMVENPASGLLIFRQALFSSQKATNTLLTLMRESMQLPLACANVIHKVLFVSRNWLLQIEFPPFVERNNVSIEASSLLLIHIFTSFFKSPYLTSSGDRLSSAVSVTHSILSIARDLSNPSNYPLPRPLPKVVWSELIKRITEAVGFCCSRSDAFARGTAGGFTNTLLSICVFICAIREVEIDDRMWDEIWLVFKGGIFWQQMVQQWSKVVDNVTRALILNLFAIDIHESSEEGSSVDGRGKRLASNRSDKSSDNGSVNGGGMYGNSDEETAIEPNSDKDIQSVVQSTGNTTNWLRVWMRIVNLCDPAEPQHSQQAVQTISRAIETLLSIGCAKQLVHWLAGKLLRLHIAHQPHAIPALCAVLIRADPPPEQRAQILWHLIDCLRADVSPIVLEQLPLMGVEDTSVLASPTIEALQKLVKNSEFSSKAVRVAALLALDHPEAEKILLSILENREIEIDVSSLSLCVNALSILILERADAQLFDGLLRIVAQHPDASSHLLPILCSNLTSSVRIGFHTRLVAALEQACQNPRDGRIFNDLKWQLCALSISDKPRPSWKALLHRLHTHRDVFLEGLLITLAMQFPLPNFPITQWNSIERPLNVIDPNQLKDFLKSSVFITTPGALISFQKPPVLTKQTAAPLTFTTRTVVGRHAWSVATESVAPSRPSTANAWLKSLALGSPQQFEEARRRGNQRQRTAPPKELLDPFQALPSFSSAMSASERAAQAQQAMDMLAFIRRAHRRPVKIGPSKKENKAETNSMQAWRKFAADFSLIKSTQSAAANFPRELRHLDSTLSREVHKIAVIYVGEGQDEKISILSNTRGSLHFNYFVEGLGWPVQIGPHLGYAGGLPSGQTAPYYSTVDTELIFHVSTQLSGDAQMKMKHIGNDEVHVVWSENPRQSYRREVLATRFCDVLIVLYPVSPVLIRVHIETQNPLLEFGPLFDGVYAHTKQIASLVRDTVVNASRAYRLARIPSNKLREEVFEQTKATLKDMPVAEAVTQLYVPSMRS